MKTDTTTYLALMAKGATQYQVPLFQRRFVWTREEHLDRLWSDIVARLEAPQGSGSEGHFCGSLVLDPGRFTIEGVTSVLVIDGQQRLISLQLALAALREVAKEVGLPRRAVKIQGSCLENAGEDVLGDDRLKVLPTNGDREVFRTCILQDIDDVRAAYPAYWTKSGNRVYAGHKPPAVLAAYGFFYQRIRELLDDTNREDPDKVVAGLFASIGESLSFVLIELDANDDAYTIFSSLNEGGEPLGGADLVRNDIFRRAARGDEETEALYNDKWKPVFEDDWWPDRLVKGRGWTPRIESFFATFVAIENETTLSYARLVHRYRQVMARLNVSVSEELSRLEHDARLFREMVSGVTDTELAVFGKHMLGVWELATALPLGLALARRLAGERHELREALAVLESYVARRSVVGGYSSSYNALFGSILQDLGGWSDPVQALRDRLGREQRTATRVPTDAELIERLGQEPIGERMKTVRIAHILRRVDSHLGNGKAVPIPYDAEVSVEHILPRFMGQGMAGPALR